MEKYKKFYGVIIFFAVVFVLGYGAFMTLKPKFDEVNELEIQVEKAEANVNAEKQKLRNVINKLKQLKDSIVSSQKKVYSPIESDLGSDTLFFTLYNDVIEMLHANSIKIKSIDYKYNPETDVFVTMGGKDAYFVCDLNLELVTNYVNMGKLLENIQQYPYYIKINELKVKPYAKDKKILLVDLSLRLYAHTAPAEEEETNLVPVLN